MLKHVVIRIEFNMFNQIVGVLLRVEYPGGAECYNNCARQNSAFLHK
jgi:hypothetical protein